MHKRYLVFDLETAKLVPDDASEILAHRPLGIACAAAVDVESRRPTVWHGGTTAHVSPQLSRAEAQNLVHELVRRVEDGYTLLTWNGLGFDFSILAEESGMLSECAGLALAHVDMMFHVVCSKGFPLGLDKVAQGMGLPGKPAGMSGAMAPALWSAGKHQDVLDYCVRDCEVTGAIARAAEDRGGIEWVTAKGSKATMPLPRGWLQVGDALQLPLPDTSWMRSPLPRESFMDWIRG